MKRLFIDNTEIELPTAKSGSFDFNEIVIIKQISDIWSFGSVVDSGTNQFSIPMTKNNIQVFEATGLSSVNSRFPYERISASYSIDGISIFYDAWLKIDEVDYEKEVYKVSVEGGAIDFFKEIENKSVAEYIADDLKALTHERNPENVVASFSNDTYKYAIADFGGKFSFNNNGQEVINVDYMVPFVYIPFLIDKIIAKAGYTKVGSIFNNEGYKNLAISFPDAVLSSRPEDAEILASLKVDYGEGVYENNLDHSLTVAQNIEKSEVYRKEWTDENIIEGELAPDNWSYVVPNDGDIHFTFSADLQIRLDGSRPLPPKVLIYIDDQKYKLEMFNPAGGTVLPEVTRTINNLRKGQKIKLILSIVNNPTIISHRSLKFEGYMKIDFKDASRPIVDIEDSLTDVPVYDLFKETLNRFGLSISVDNVKKEISFYTIKERLQTAEKGYDLSECYSKKTKEYYKVDTYARRNWFKYQYDNDKSEYFNGFIDIGNENLDQKTDLFESIFYAPEKELVSLTIGGEKFNDIYKYKFWESEVKENGDEIEVVYSDITGRFYLGELKELKGLKPDLKAKFGSEIFNESIVENNPSSQKIHKVDFSKLSFGDINTEETVLGDYYKEATKYLETMKICIMDLDMPLDIFSNIQLDKLYYFAQEQAWFMCNELQLRKGKVEGEFIRVNI